MALAALLEDEADLPLSADGDEESEALTGIDLGNLSGYHPGPSSPGGLTMEPCLLGNEEVMIPSELCLNPEMFVDVMNLGWHSLSDQERSELFVCLPSFPEPENDFQEKLSTLDGLFAGVDFHFGNPLKQFHASLNAGFYQPDVFRLREVSRKLKFHAHLERQQRHAVSLLCELATSRQQLLLDAKCLPPAALDSYRLSKRLGGLSDKKPLAVKRARSRYSKIMSEVRQEAGLLETSSSGEENDEQSGQLQHQFSDLALNAEDLDEDSVFKTCLKVRSKSLKKPKSRRSAMSPPPLPPDNELFEILDRADIKLPNVTLTSGKIPKQGQQHVNGNLLLAKPKKPGQRRARLELLKVACNDFVRKMLTTPSSVPPPPSTKTSSVSNAESLNNGNGSNTIQIAQPRSRPQSSVAVTPTPSTSTPPASTDPIQTSPGANQIAQSTSPPQLPPVLMAATSSGKVQSFFHVIHGLLTATPDSRATITSLEQLVKQWVQVASATFASCSSTSDPSWHALRWLNDRNNWHNELPSAMRYLTGTFCPANCYPVDFVPLVDMNDRSGHWVWLDDETELNLLYLYKHWLDAQLAEKQIPPSTVPFRPESEQDVYFFHDQERKRFSIPTEPFVYVLTMPSPRELVVGPVRVTPSRVDSFSSSRKGVVKDHSILAAERPPAVTVLTLVRDAVARLAGGEGTRTDICNLLRDSQFIRRDLNNSQLTNAVSGALDRLHSERDPCARYDSTKKLWIYLHRGRTRDDFVRIGQMLMMAAKRRQAKDAAISASTIASNSSSIGNGVMPSSGVPQMVSMLPGPSIGGPTKGSTSSSKGNANRRTSAAVSASATGIDAGGVNALQRKSSSISAPFSAEMMQQQQQSVPQASQSQPPTLPPPPTAPNVQSSVQQQQIMHPSQMQPPQQQLPSPSHIPQQMFNGPMIRGPIPGQNLQMQPAQQSSPRQPMQQPQQSQQGQQPPQAGHMGIPSQPGMQPGPMSGWPPNNAVPMSMPVSMMGASQTPNVVMSGPLGAPPPPNAGMMPMHLAGGQPITSIRHQGMHIMQNVPGLPPQQQPPPQSAHFQAPQPQQQPQQQYHPQMHHHSMPQQQQTHPMHHGLQSPQHMHPQPQLQPPQHGVDQHQAYYTEQQQHQMHNQQMLLFHHHQQQQQQQQYRLVHQVGSQSFPTHHPMPQQPPQNMMQQGHAQFQTHPHGL